MNSLNQTPIQLYSEKIIASCFINRDNFFRAKSDGITALSFNDNQFFYKTWEIIERNAVNYGITPFIVAQEFVCQSEQEYNNLINIFTEYSNRDIHFDDLSLSIEKLLEKTKTNLLGQLANNIQKNIVEGKNSEDITSLIMSQLLNINTSGNGNIKEYTSRGALKATGLEIKKRLDGDVSDGVQTGIRTLDEEIKYFYYGFTTMVIARPGHGKTTLMINTFLNNILAGKKPVFFSLEMPVVHLMIKILGILTKIEVNKIMDPILLSKDELNSLKNAIQFLGRFEFYIVDAVSLSTLEFSLYLDKYVMLGSEIAYLDYIQLLKLANGKTPKDAGDFRDIGKSTSEAVKRVNRKGPMALVLAAQASRDVEKRPIEERIPMMKDIEWSSSFEQDTAVAIGVLNREKYEGEECEYKNQLFIGFPKHRYNTAYRVNLAFLQKIQYITDLAHPSKEEYKPDRWKKEAQRENDLSEKEEKSS